MVQCLCIWVNPSQHGKISKFYRIPFWIRLTSRFQSSPNYLLLSRNSKSIITQRGRGGVLKWFLVILQNPNFGARAKRSVVPKQAPVVIQTLLEVFIYCQYKKDQMGGGGQSNGGVVIRQPVYMLYIIIFFLTSKCYRIT